MLDAQMLLQEAQRASHDRAGIWIVHCALESAAAIRVLQKDHNAPRSYGDTEGIEQSSQRTLFCPGAHDEKRCQARRNHARE
jgi:hypothetical protein